MSSAKLQTRSPKMSPRVRNQIAKPREQALAAFIGRKAEIDAMLTPLQALSDDHFGYAPDGAMSAPVSITPSCSSASRTKPLRRANMPRNRTTSQQQRQIIKFDITSPTTS